MAESASTVFAAKRSRCRAERRQLLESERTKRNQARPFEDKEPLKLVEANAHVS